MADPKQEAAFLLAQLLGTDRGGLHVRREDPVQPDLFAVFEEWVRRREAREPAQHITGEREFHGLRFHSDARALVPRPETESLIDVALELELPRGARVLDVGTGSGCIAVTLAVRRPDLLLVAWDRSAAALSLARENAALHGVQARIEFAEVDFRKPPVLEPVTLAVSNPPYVSEAEWETLEPEVRDHDPKEALVPGPGGYEAYDDLAPRAIGWLLDGGHLLIEVGRGQSTAVAERLRGAGFEAVEVREDLQGIPRVLLARKPGKF